jgi:lysozyme family protein
MANKDGIIKWVIRFEDSTLSGVVTNLPGDSGGMTRFGIASNAHPEVPASFYTTDVATALFMAEQIYANQYWHPLHLDSVNDDGLASVMMDFGVNTGVSRAVKELQILLGTTQDGVIGPHTLQLIQNADQPTLAVNLRAQRAAWDKQVVANNPADAPFLKNWLKRAALIYPDNGGL